MSSYPAADFPNRRTAFDAAVAELSGEHPSRWTTESWSVSRTPTAGS